MRWYLAREWGRFNDPLTALTDAGLPADKVQTLISRSALNRGGMILVAVDEVRGIVLCPDGDAWRRWQADIAKLFDTKEEAAHVMKRISERIGMDVTMFSWGAAGVAGGN
jgi:hypothetical protein